MNGNGERNHVLATNYVQYVVLDETGQQCQSGRNEMRRCPIHRSSVLRGPSVVYVVYVDEVEHVFPTLPSHVCPPSQ